MKEIESIQTEVGQFLISMIPVPWEKICLYAECENGCASIWFGFKEEKTNVICTQEFFWERYQEYPIKERDVNLNLPDLVENLHNAYIEKFGETKKWCTMYYTVGSDYSVKINFGYEMPTGNYVQIHHKVFEHFFETPYKYHEEKYPY